MQYALIGVAGPVVQCEVSIYAVCVSGPEVERVLVVKALQRTLRDGRSIGVAGLTGEEISQCPQIAGNRRVGGPRPSGTVEGKRTPFVDIVADIQYGAAKLSAKDKGVSPAV